MTSVATRVLLFLVLLFSLTARSAAQTASPVEAKGTGSISGRVTLGDKPVPGIVIAVLKGDNNSAPDLLARATTDGDGQYRLTGLAAGHMRVTAAAAAYVVTSESSRSWEPGKVITLGDGEAIEGLDFSLARGGVMTGRITGPGGRPLIAERVELNRVNEQGQRQPYYSPNYYYIYQTDDRGVYRLYGLPEGRYLVSAGLDESRPQTALGAGGRIYKRTFHPDTTDEAQATIIEVTPGKEVTGVDIRLGKSVQTYSASGRVIDAESGRPVPGISVGYGTVENKRFSTMMSGLLPNAQGEFKVEGLLPGSYAVYSQQIMNPAAPENAANDYYSDPAPFEIAGDNVTGLEIRLQHGSSISGVAVIEGTNDPAVLAKLTQLKIQASMQRRNAGQNDAAGGASGLEAPGSFSSPLAANGSFRFSGLRPGTARLYLNPWQAPKGFSIMRIERDGQVPQSLEIGPGEQISGVRVVIAYGDSVIRGQVKIEGEAPPGTLRMTVYPRRVEASTSGLVPGIQPVEVDARGRFMIEGLVAGTYALQLQAYLVQGTGMTQLRIPPVIKQITVGGGTTDVVMTLNLTEKEKKQ